ncbi:hypothetical protein PHET_00727 [Paragonimus heterotremus]|uniref:Uncharacterized protein n=1 Tax=Paragonimus heterotremus TaxID=100268 RepID=A0A8J4STA4_9TREM|nr:hypothetical protein PHET_00727 [Paragonimus heterotremus]
MESIRPAALPLCKEPRLNLYVQGWALASFYHPEYANQDWLFSCTQYFDIELQVLKSDLFHYGTGMCLGATSPRTGELMNGFLS